MGVQELVCIIFPFLLVGFIYFLCLATERGNELRQTRRYWLECQKNYEAVGAALDAVGPWSAEMTPIMQAEAMRDIELHRRKNQRA